MTGDEEKDALRMEEVLARVVEGVRGIRGVAAVALGGSWARGRARPDSDLDVGLYLEDPRALDVEAVRAAVARLHDGPAPPTVTGPGAWGPFANGGAWLVCDGRRVDLVYRDLPALRAVLADCRAGRVTLHDEQQPPFGFASWTWLGELAVARPLHDPSGALAALRAEVAAYPPALRARVVGDQLWSAAFALHAARGFAERGDAVHVVACLARATRGLEHALFAWNARWWLSEKTALAEIDEMPERPRDFAARWSALCAEAGATPGALAATVRAAQVVFDEAAALCAPLYAAKWRLP